MRTVYKVGRPLSLYSASRKPLFKPLKKGLISVKKEKEEEGKRRDKKGR